SSAGAPRRAGGLGSGRPFAGEGRSVEPRAQDSGSAALALAVARTVGVAMWDRLAALLAVADRIGVLLGRRGWGGRRRSGRRRRRRGRHRRWGGRWRTRG